MMIMKKASKEKECVCAGISILAPASIYATSSKLVIYQNVQHITHSKRRNHSTGIQPNPSILNQIPRNPPPTQKRPPPSKTKRNQISRLHHRRPRNQGLHHFHKKRPRLDPPNHQTRHRPPKHHADASLRPNRHDLRHLFALVVRRLLDRLPVRGQIREDGGAQGSDGICGVHGRAGAVGGHVADGVDVCGGENAEGFGVGTDVAAFVEPGGREE